MSFTRNTKKIMNPLLNQYLKNKKNIKNLSSKTIFGSDHKILKQDRLASQNFKDSQPNKLEGVILDWSGTVTDKYVIAPAIVFVDSFKHFGVDVTMQEARGPMGIRKDLHIKQMTELESIREKWHKVHNRYPNDEDVQKMYEYFIPTQLECLHKYSKLLPGVASITQDLQRDGLLIGTTTGFSKAMVDILLKSARQQGYNPDSTIAGDDVINGTRPCPHMIYKNMDILNISNPKSIVKVDDTVGGIGEGLSAGSWTVGVSKWSNYVDVDSFEHEKRLSNSELERKRLLSRDVLLHSGAHYVIDDLNQLPEVVADINHRMSKGDTPDVDLRKEDVHPGMIIPPYM